MLFFILIPEINHGARNIAGVNIVAFQERSVCLHRVLNRKKMKHILQCNYYKLGHIFPYFYISANEVQYKVHKRFAVIYRIIKIVNIDAHNINPVFQVSVYSKSKLCQKQRKKNEFNTL